MELNIKQQTLQFTGPIVFDNMRNYQCPLCGTMAYFYDGDHLVFTMVHRNMHFTDDHFNLVTIPRCQRCATEFAHMLKSIELMKKQGNY